MFFLLLHGNLIEAVPFILDIPNNTDGESVCFEVMLSETFGGTFWLFSRCVVEL